MHTLSQSFYDAEILLGIEDVDSMDKPTCLMVQIKAIQNRYLLESQGQSGDSVVTTDNSLLVYVYTCNCR